MKTYIGIDNGVSGSIGIITYDDKRFIFKTPIKNELNFQKTVKKNINRIKVSELTELLSKFIVEGVQVMVLMERPMINSQYWEASMSAIRALEATLITIESLGLPFQYIDSKGWQKQFLPVGLKGSPELKKASLDIGRRLWPELSNFKHTDFDSLFIAEFGKRNNI
jgi:hypothetical protein